jgi:hypothetical protein
VRGGDDRGERVLLSQLSTMPGTNAFKAEMQSTSCSFEAGKNMALGPFIRWHRPSSFKIALAALGGGCSTAPPLTASRLTLILLSGSPGESAGEPSTSLPWFCERPWWTTTVPGTPSGRGAGLAFGCANHPRALLGVWLTARLRI